MTFTPEIIELATQLVSLCRQKKITISAAESCTGGLVVGAITEIPGASDCLEVSFVTYSNYMKTRVLGVARKPWMKLVRSLKRSPGKWPLVR